MTPYRAKRRRPSVMKGPQAPGTPCWEARDPVPWYLQETPYRGGSE